ncbi:MAG TPA: AAA family ATPase, partial [Clostridia bacterium]|nr:AAA family ATPase [Clostridia bacterium]
MQFINEQYNVVKAKSHDSYGTTYVVEDIQKGNLLKHLRIIGLQKETRDFIEYMKDNFYDYSMYSHPNLIDFHFYNKIRLIDYKQVTVNQYYYTYDYYEGVNAIDYCKGKDLDTVLNLVAELCSAVKYLHLRGFLLYYIDMNDLQVVLDDKIDCLKIASIPYPQKTSSKIMIGKDSVCIKDPEVLKKKEYSILSDIYIIGAVIFHLFSGLNTFDLNDNSIIDKNIMSIIKKCTTAELSDRFQTVDDIIFNINDCFDKHYSIIEKQYIQAMPQYRIKPVARYYSINKILNNAKGHFFADRSNKAALIVGQEGSGKSDFLEALSVRVEHEGFIPIQTILNESDLIRFSLLEVFVKSITKYADKELIDKYIGDLNNVVSQISRYRSIPSNTEGNSLWEDGRGKFIQKINNFIIEASNRFHFVFIIDNFQWIDEDSLEFVDEILKGQGSSKTYIVFATDKDTFSRSTEVKEYCGKLKEAYSLDSIELKNFTLEDTAEYIRLVLGMGKPNYEFARIIYDKTKGSPEYIYDTIYMLYSNNNIYVDDKGSWVLDKVDFESLNLSYSDDIDTLNNVYKLNANYQDILKILSIFNIPVSSDVVENFVEVKQEKLASQLNYLSYINILVRKQNDWGISYNFSSLTLKKSIYEGIPVQLRQKYHEKASYVLKSKFSRENRENEDELIHQMLRANWHLEVKQYLVNSANEMIEDNSIGQAIQFLEHTYSLFSNENIIEEKVLVCTKLGELYERMGEYSKAIFHYNIVENVAKDTKNNYLIIDVYIKKYSLLYKLNDKKTSLKYLAWAKKLLRSTDYKKGMYEHIIVINRMMLHKRKFSAYIKILENAIGSIDKEEYRFLYARLLGIYGRFKAYKGRHEEGLAALTESLQILESMGNFRKMLYPLTSIGSIYYSYNDIQKAREYYEKCLSISQRVSDIYYVGISYNNIAEQYRMEDKYSEALHFYQNSLENIILIRDMYAEFIIYMNMAMTNIQIEDYNKALAMQNDMQEDFINSKYSGNLMDLFHHCRAEFYYSIGDYVKAGEYAQKSIDTCISWGIAENYEAHFVKLLSEIQLSGRLDYERDRMFLDMVFGENLYKLGRTACVKLAEIYISKGIRDRAKELLQRGLSYV